MSSSSPVFVSRPRLVCKKPNFSLELRGWWSPLENQIMGQHLLGLQSNVVILSRSDFLARLEFTVDSVLSPGAALSVRQGDKTIFSLNAELLADTVGEKQQIHVSVAEGPNTLIFNSSGQLDSYCSLACSAFDIEVLS